MKNKYFKVLKNKKFFINIFTKNLFLIKKPFNLPKQKKLNVLKRKFGFKKKVSFKKKFPKKFFFKNFFILKKKPLNSLIIDNNKLKFLNKKILPFLYLLKKKINLTIYKNFTDLNYLN